MAADVAGVLMPPWRYNGGDSAQVCGQQDRCPPGARDQGGGAGVEGRGPAPCSRVLSETEQAGSSSTRWLTHSGLYTPGGSQYCEAWIHRFEIVNGKYKDMSTARAVITTKGSYYSDWQTVTQGDEVCLRNTSGQLECEPDE